MYVYSCKRKERKTENKHCHTHTHTHTQQLILVKREIYSIPMHQIGTLTTVEYFPSKKSTSFRKDALADL